MSISDLLMSQKRWGRARCRRLLLSIGVPENKEIGTLTERQRPALAAVLRRQAPSAARRERSRPLSVAWTAAQVVELDPGPGGGELHDVAVRVAQVDRLEEGRGP